MPSFSFLSPRIQINEVDQSQIEAVPPEEGPIIIGRTRRGPGMRPVRIDNMDQFTTVFGKPVAGGSSQGDVWRDGPNRNAPTYAAYAAQSWLASGNSPITMVRLMGDQKDGATGTGMAGWQLSASIASSDDAANSTAYGLFIVESGSVGICPTPLVLETAADFATRIADSSIEHGTNGSRLAFFRGTSVETKTKAAGLQMEIIFDVVTSGEGTVTRDATGGTDSCPLFTIDVLTSTNAATILTYIQSALDNALVAGDISNINAAIDSDSKLEILNFDTATRFGVVDEKNSFNYFKASGVRIDDAASVSGGNLAGGGLGNADEDIAVAAAIGQQSLGEGALAAIIYCDSGYLALSGTVAIAKGSTGEKHSVPNTLIKSIGDNLAFGLDVYNTTGAKIGSTLKFNFSRNSATYIRNVLNTDPTLINSDRYSSPNLKTYFLGETFERHVKSYVTTSTSGQQYGILLPLHKSDNGDASGNWSYHRAGSADATTGWIIGDDGGNDNTSYDATSAVKLFRLESLHSGDEIQGEIFVSIEDLKLAPNPETYKYSTFSVKIKDITSGKTLESYTNLNLDPNSNNFIAKRIGDANAEWDQTELKYLNSGGNNPNNSDYVRVVMYAEQASNVANKAILPFGFLGQGRPKSFMLASGSTSALSVDGGAFSGVYVKGSGSAPGFKNRMVKGGGTFFSSSLTGVSAKFHFPKPQLRISGSDGGTSNPYKAMFGIRPKINTTSDLHDVDYVDYVRALPSNYSGMDLNPSGDFEHNVMFTLDDIRIDTTANTVHYQSGSRKNGTSYTATNNVSSLLDKKVKQFAVPLFGGRHGMDITEAEPFRNSLMDSLGATDSTNYLRYSVKKALDTVSDVDEIQNVNLLVVPGIYDTVVTNKMLKVASDRQDIMAIIDIENDYKSIYESTESASTRRGSVANAVSSLKDRSLNNSFGAAYYPSIQIVDNLNNGRRVWVPSSVAGLGAIAQSEAASAAWFAPAGFNRGGLGNLGGTAGPAVVQTSLRLDSDNRDDLYAQNINPIANFPNEGIVVFGQKTLQNLIGGAESALSRINVRRLLLYLKRRINRVAKTVLFEQNVPATWANFRAGAEPILADVQSRFGLTEYKLVLDETTTTPDLIDRNVLYVQIFLKPARAIEYIVIDFIVTRSGAEFA